MNPPGISIISGTPLWSDSVDNWHLTQQVEQYQHTIQAVGGYWSAQFTIKGDRKLADDWLQDGLGRHIEVYDGSLTQIWEGFVDKLVVSYGPLSVTQGPLLDVANRVSITYSTIEYDEDDNPVVGTRVTSAVQEDTDSQDIWGIIPKVLSTGGVEDNDATEICQTYLAEHSQPEVGKSFRSDSSRDTSVTVYCKGYVHWLNWPYDNTTGGTDDADDKLIAVLGDSPNVAWLAISTEHVDANTLQVPLWEDENNLALSVVKDIVARGGTSNERWIFGIYANLEAYYQAAPTAIEYQQRLSQPKPIVEGIGGDEVYPWNVLPGKWLMFPDFLIGQAAELDLADDPRCMFIETVKFTAPQGLDLTGGKTDTLDAVLAQMGLSGIGA